MQNPEGKFTCCICIMISKQITIIFKGAMTLTLLLRPVSHKLKDLRNVNDHQLTVVVQHPVAVWRP